MQCYPQVTEEAQTDRRSRSGSVLHFVQVARWRASPGVACTPESTHVLSAPLGLFCSSWSRQRCSDVLMDTPHFHFFKYSHFCKQYNFRAQLLGGTLTQTSFPGCPTLSVYLEQSEDDVLRIRSSWPMTDRPQRHFLTQIYSHFLDKRSFSEWNPQRWSLALFYFFFLSFIWLIFIGLNLSWRMC